MTVRRKGFQVIMVFCLVVAIAPMLMHSQDKESARAILGTDDRMEDRHRMVRTQIESRGIQSDDVLTAMQRVPRHLFIPPSHRAAAYQDRPLPIGHGQTISQPYIVAYMTEAIALDSTDKVLEIGTGSGYQAAVLAEITPDVSTIEIIRELGEQAAHRLKRLGYTNIRTKVADGYYGWEEEGAFDAILVTAAAGHVPPPLLKQLKPGGVMIIPVGSVYQVQTLMQVTKSLTGEIRTESLMPVRFVPLTGQAQE